MCVYFVAMMCAGRFGLGWAHDFFLVCMSHVHTYVPSFLYISIYWCVWCFCVCVCVCLSLSLSLSISCIMASKQKSVLSQNPLRSGASTSSSDPTPSSVWFRDEKAHKNFSENFSRWGIHSERQVILSDFSNTDLPAVIYSRGWESLCGILITCPSVIIQEFYSNMHGFDYSIPQFITRV